MSDMTMYRLTIIVDTNTQQANLEHLTRSSIPLPVKAFHAELLDNTPKAYWTTAGRVVVKSGTIRARSAGRTHDGVFTVERFLTLDEHAALTTFLAAEGYTPDPSLPGRYVRRAR